MIFEAIVDVLATFFEWVGGLLPEIDVPSWIGTIASSLATVTGFMAPLGVWVPFSAAQSATLLVVAAVVVALGTKVIRVLVSLFTGGGGGAA